MALTKLTTDVSNVGGLSDKPNVDDGLSPAQLKAVFDKASEDIKAYINNTLTSEVDSDFATKIELAAAVLSGISDNSITNAKLVDKTIENGKIADDTITVLNLSAALKAAQYYGKYSLMSGGATTAPGIVAFTTEVKDDFSAINLAASTSKITIPAGVTLARFHVTGKVTTGNASPLIGTCKLYKGGVDTGVNLGSSISGSSKPGIISCYTVPITVSAGEYYEVYYSDNSYSLLDLTAATFMMEVLG